MRRHTTLILVLFLAIAVRAGAFAIEIDPFHAPDSHSFISLAESFSDTGRLEYEDQGAPGVRLRAFRSLLYPVMLRATGSDADGVTGALILQALLGVVVVATVYVVGRRTLGRETGIVAAAIGAVYWTSIYFERQVLTESIYTFLLVTGVALAMGDSDAGRKPAAKTAVRIVLSGLVLGLASITRPVGLAAIAAVALVWVAAYLVARLRGNAGTRSLPRVLALLACLVAGAAIVIAPALYRNHRVLGHPVLLTSGGMNFWAGNGRGTIPQAWQIMGDKIDDYGEVGMDRWFYQDVRAHRDELLRQAPRMALAKVWAFFAPSTRETVYLPLRFLLPFVLLGLIRILPAAGEAAWLLIAVIGSQVLAALVFVPWPRYRAPIDPFLYLLAAAGLVFLWKWGSRGRWTIAALFGVNLLALLVR